MLLNVYKSAEKEASMIDKVHSVFYNNGTPNPITQASGVSRRF